MVTRTMTIKHYKRGRALAIVANDFAYRLESNHELAERLAAKLVEMADDRDRWQRRAQRYQAMLAREQELSLERQQPQ